MRLEWRYKARKDSKNQDPSIYVLEGDMLIDQQNYGDAAGRYEAQVSLLQSGGIRGNGHPSTEARRSGLCLRESGWGSVYTCRTIPKLRASGLPGSIFRRVIYVLEGDMLIDQQNYGDAAGRYESAITFDANNPEGYVKYANAYRHCH